MIQQRDEHRGNILVVDDTLANLQLLVGMLTARGYKVRPAPSGAMALRAAEVEPPDLVLLDINMPGISGYDVCERLKAHEALKSIPVIFLSAMSETFDKVVAFSVGGVDYVTKPFEVEEVVSRIETHLSISRLRQRLEVKNRELQLAYKDLRSLESMRSDLVHMIVHDLRGPMSGVIGYLELIKRDELSDRNKKFVNKSAQSAGLMLESINTLLDIDRMESSEMPVDLQSVELSACLQQAIEALGGLTFGKVIEVPEFSEPIHLKADASLLRRVLTNLLGNALKFCGRSAVRVTVEKTEAQSKISVIDKGPGIAKEYHQKIFEKFGQVEARRSKKVASTGLGLPFCLLATEAQSGTIGVESEPGAGSCFWILMPNAKPDG